MDHEGTTSYSLNNIEDWNAPMTVHQNTPRCYKKQYINFQPHHLTKTHSIVVVSINTIDKPVSYAVRELIDELS